MKELLKNPYCILYLFFIVLLTSCDTETLLYVAPDGNDNNQGTLSAPLKTVEGAKNRIKDLVKENPDKVIRINLRGGLYPIEDPLIFTNENTGKATVFIQAYQEEEPVISGSRKLTQWELLQDQKMLDRLNESVRGKVYVTDLKEIGIDDFGNPIDKGLRPELYCNHQQQILARWPNEGYIQTGKVKGETELPPTYIAKDGSKEGIFEYTDTYQDRWSTEKDICLKGYWYWNWSDEAQRV